MTRWRALLAALLARDRPPRGSMSRCEQCGSRAMVQYPWHGTAVCPRCGARPW